MTQVRSCNRYVEAWTTLPSFPGCLKTWCIYSYIYIYVLIRYISVYPRTKAWRIVIQKSLSNIITHPQRHLVLLHALYLFIP